MKYNKKTATIAVINEYNKLLILRRGKTAPWMPGRYCLPGGHVEPNEDGAYAAVRELSEETGLSFPVDNLKYVNVIFDNNYTKTIHVAQINDPKVILNFEHDHYAWISRSDSFSYDLVPRLDFTIKTLYQKGLII